MITKWANITVISLCYPPNIFVMHKVTMNHIHKFSNIFPYILSTHRIRLHQSRTFLNHFRLSHVFCGCVCGCELIKSNRSHVASIHCPLLSPFHTSSPLPFSLLCSRSITVHIHDQSYCESVPFSL